MKDERKRRYIFRSPISMWLIVSEWNIMLIVRRKKKIYSIIAAVVLYFFTLERTIHEIFREKSRIYIIAFGLFCLIPFSEVRYLKNVQNKLVKTSKEKRKQDSAILINKQI